MNQKVYIYIVYIAEDGQKVVRRESNWPVTYQYGLGMV